MEDTLVRSGAQPYSHKDTLMIELRSSECCAGAPSSHKADDFRLKKQKTETDMSFGW